MIYNDDVFNERTMNIACDGAIKKNSILESYAYCAAVAVSGYDSSFQITTGDRGKVKATNTLSKVYKVRDYDINIAELLALDLAVDLAIKYKSKINSFNIYTDSLFVINMMKKHLFYWYIDEYGSITNRMNEEPKYVADTLRIVRKIVASGINISLYHTLAHKNVTSKDDMETNRSTFIVRNDIKNDVDIEIIKNIAKLNALVDYRVKQLMTKSYTKVIDYETIVDKDITIDNVELTMYKEYMH